MLVHIPGPLLSYTNGQKSLDLSAKSLLELTQKLDEKFPGIKFRMIDEQDHIREHIKIFVDKEEVKTLETSLDATAVVHITCSLSGG